MTNTELDELERRLREGSVYTFGSWAQYNPPPPICVQIADALRALRQENERMRAVLVNLAEVKRLKDEADRSFLRGSERDYLMARYNELAPKAWHSIKEILANLDECTKVDNKQDKVASTKS